MISVTRKVQFVRRPNKSWAIVSAPQSAEAPPPGRGPRISRLMALAIHFDRLVREGKVADQSELARLAHVTQPRMTQVMNLNHLAPDIQAELLFLARVTRGRERITERDLRALTAKLSWAEQRNLWQRLQQSAGGQSSEV
jgi:hypothetical protein